MKTLLQRSFTALTLVAAFASASFAGAWTAKKGAYYDKAAFNYYESTDTFNATGRRTDTPNNGTFTDYNVSNYLEYGLLDNLTVINSLTYKWLENEDDSRLTKGHGIGDIDLGLRYRLVDSDKWGIVSAQLLVKIPGGYKKSDPLPLGNGQYDGELRLLYGRSLWPLLPGYANAEFGYRWRAGDPADEYRYLLELGFDLTQKLYTRAKLDGIISADNGTKLDTSGNPTSTNNYDLGKLDLTVGYKVSPAWGVEASYTPAIYGQNTAAGATYSLAAYFKTP
jgi:hypothetical protein